MPGTPTTKYALPKVAATDFMNAFPGVQNALVDTLDQLIAAAITGVRPAAGKFGRFHQSGAGVLSFDTGSAWIDLVATTAVDGLSFVGAIMLDAGNSDFVTASQEWVRADGRLVDRTVYAAYFARVGHAHNGGVDPGGNSVRLPDYRGRALVGADNMGTTAGAGNRLPNSNRARGQNGGEERHVLSAAETAAKAHSHTVPSHGHSVSDPGHGHAFRIHYYATAGFDYGHHHAGNQGVVAERDNVQGAPVGVEYDWGVGGSSTGISVTGSSAFATTGNPSDGVGVAHNNLQPYACDNVMVRIK